jgi:hypothetical protein
MDGVACSSYCVEVWVNFPIPYYSRSSNVMTLRYESYGLFYGNYTEETKLAIL